MKNRAKQPFFNHRIWSLFIVLVMVLAACTPAGGPPAGGLSPVTGQQPAEPESQSAGPTGVVPAANAANPHLALLFAYPPSEQTLHITRIDLRSGRLLADEQPLVIGEEVNYAFSPDRSKLAVSAKSANGAISANCPGTCLRIFGLADMQETARVQLPEMKDINDHIHLLVFDPAGRRVAVSYTDQGQGRLAVFDTTQHKPEGIQEAALPFAPRLMAFSADGQQMMLVGFALPENESAPAEVNPQSQAILLNSQTLRAVWQQELPDLKDGFYGSGDHTKPEENFYYTAGMAADPALRRVYIAHADADRLTTVDFKAQRVTTVNIRDKQTGLQRLLEFVLSIGARPVQAKAANSYFRQALLAADGRTLYVVGERTNLVDNKNDQWEMVTTPYGLQAWALHSADRLLTLETQATEIRRAPDGRILLNGYDRESATYQPFSQVFDPGLGQITAHLAETYAYMTLGLAGEPVLVSGFSSEQEQTALSILNADTLEAETAWTHEEGYAFWPELR